MNRLQLKALLLSIITEIKFGEPLARNAIGIKNGFKNLVGLPKNSPNMKVLESIKSVYKENGFLGEFEGIEKRFKIKVVI